jgi:hypothetical protein
MNKFAFAFLCLLGLRPLNAQQALWEKLWQTAVNGKSIGTDNLGNAYALNGDVLSKYRDNGEFYRIYSNKRLGNISLADVGNPLKILVFYRDFSRIIFLDNTLTENGNPLQLEDRELELASLACTSFDNGLWIYDPVRFMLVRYNQQLQETVRITNLNQILGYAPEPDFMTEYESVLYMNDPARGILRFDIFGTYLSLIPLKSLKNFQVADNTVFYNTGTSTLMAFGLKTLQTDTIHLPVNNYSDLRWWKDRIYVLTHDSLSVYRYLPAR